MKKNPTHQFLITLMATVLFLILSPLTALAAIPQTINYQGYLTDPQGTPIDETVTVTFSIYPNTTEMSPLWTETQTVSVTDGIFSVNLGNVTPLSLSFDATYYLGITVGSDSEMTPRQALSSVGYAFRAKEADRVKDNAVTTEVIANDAVTTDKVADDAISEAKIAPGAVGSTALANGAVGASQIGDGTIATEHLADAAVTADKIKPAIISSIDGVSNDGGNVDLVAGSNVTITPDDTAKTITIASTGGGSSSPWTESGRNVYRSSGNVGIGTSSPQEKLHVEGDIQIPSNTGIKNANGNEIFHTGWNSHFGGYTDIKSGYSWDKSGEPVAVVAGEYGVFFTKGDASGNPHAESFMNVSTDGELALTGGVKFADGTVQTTAAAPPWHQMLPSAERFQLVLNNQAVLDRETGLVWERTPSTKKTNYHAAFYHCYWVEMVNRRGWRLPTIEEITSLVDTSGSPLRLPTDHPFNSVQAYYYWSSTTDSFDTSNAYVVSFGNGELHWGGKQNTMLHVWCVRGGVGYDGY